MKRQGKEGIVGTEQVGATEGGKPQTTRKLQRRNLRIENKGKREFTENTKPDSVQRKIT